MSRAQLGTAGEEQALLAHPLVVVHFFPFPEPWRLATSFFLVPCVRQTPHTLLFRSSTTTALPTHQVSGSDCGVRVNQCFIQGHLFHNLQ